MQRSAWFGAAALLLSAGCQQPAPEVYRVETSRTYPASQPEMRDRLLRALAAQGLELTPGAPAPGVVTATRSWDEPLGWAACERVRVFDRGSDTRRRTRARPDGREVELWAALSDAAGGTAVDLDARFEERQINPYVNMAFQQPCQSTGVLERALLDTLSAAR